MSYVTWSTVWRNETSGIPSSTYSFLVNIISDLLNSFGKSRFLSGIILLPPVAFLLTFFSLMIHFSIFACLKNSFFHFFVSEQYFYQVQNFRLVRVCCCCCCCCCFQFYDDIVSLLSHLCSSLMRYLMEFLYLFLCTKYFFFSLILRFSTHNWF